ncbi:hypothetical protein BJ165DRAFT_1511096 [Panaeolus papilionaceus]|nr:hypothetical protein BJ165DRAFT_1511096 [Panaeolus papilionaceus]
MSLTPIRTIGISFIIVGSFIRSQSMKALGKFFTPQTDMRIQANHKLITAFSYSIIRHPAYLAILLSHIGCLMCSFTQGSWVREVAC